MSIPPSFRPCACWTRAAPGRAVTPAALPPAPSCRPRGFGPGGKYLALIRTAWRLGPGNGIAVAAYRLALKTGLARRLTPAGPALTPPRFDPARLRPPGPDAAPASLIAEAEAARDGQLAYFGWDQRQAGSPPDWRRNPVTGVQARDGHWSLIPDFDAAVGDVKDIWEASRFHWAPLFAQAARATGDSAWVDLLNAWMADWCTANPLNQGPNWKCGQETGLRLLAVFEAARILDQDLLDGAGFIAAHCARIAPTMRYAIAQRNNHATSEAAALFVGGAWLATQGGQGYRSRGLRWCARGRQWLNRAAVALIEPDGGFAQGSANYHRLMIDTVSAAERWRRTLGQPALAEPARQRLAAAADWLAVMTDPDTGRAPNLGPNDGAWFYRMPGCDYGDFRAAVAEACRLFRDEYPYPPGPWAPKSPAVRSVPRQSRDFPDSGYHVLATGRTWAMLRTAHRFRPSQADALHVDLWRDGTAIFADGGTYSYNGDPGWTAWFPSAGAHNAPVFDGMDAMPRLGRFLFADWVQARANGPVRAQGDELVLEATCQSRDGRTCQRRLTIGEDNVRLTDRASGHSDSLTWRFRLGPGSWRLENGTCLRPGIAITIQAPGAEIALVPDGVSARYGEVRPATALEIRQTRPDGPGEGHLDLTIDFPEKAA